MSILNRYWRILGTGISFSVFGLGGLFMATIWLPMVFKVQRDPEKAKLAVQGSICRSFGLFLLLMRVLRVIDYRIDGADVLKGDRRCLIVSNHPTLIDMVLIGSTLDHGYCIVKEALWNNPFLKGAAKAAGYIPNSEGIALLNRCRETLGDQGVLVIFPEGTRTTPNQPIKLQRGAANIAVRLNYNVRVVNIRCEPLTLIKGESWYQVPRRRPFWTVEVKELIEVHRFVEDAPSLSAAARRLNTYLAEVLVPPHPTTILESPSS